MKYLFNYTTIILLMFSSVYKAQDNHYWNLFAGNESAVLGGIVLDGVNDYSTTYFNPGNIAFLKISGLEVSGNVVAYLDYLHVNAAGEANNLKRKQFTVLPNMGAGALPYNPEKESRIGYLFFERSNSALTLNNRVKEKFDVIPTRSYDIGNQNVNYYEGDERYVGEINTDHHLLEYWGGISYGRKLSNQFGIGLTMFLSLRDQIKDYDLSIFAVDTVNSVAATTDWNYMIDYYDFRILAKLGLVFKSESFKLGLTFTTPSIHIYGSGDIGGRVTSTGVVFREIPNTNTSRAYDFVASKRESDVKTNYISPLSIGFGFNKVFGSWRVRVSVEWFNNVAKHTLIEANDLYFTITDPNNDSTNVSAQIPLLRYNQQAKSIVNYGIALEKKFTENFVAYFSFRTDYSSFKDDDDISLTLGGSDDWNIYRFTTGGTYKFSKTIIGLGFQYSFSLDSEMVSNTNLNPEQIDENSLFLLNTTPTSSRINYNEYKLILAFTYLFGSEL